MSEDRTDDLADRKLKYRIKYDGKTAMELAVSMAEMGRRKEEAEEILKEINAEYDVLRLEQLPDRMEQEGLENMRVTGIGRISLTADMYVRLANAEEFNKWLHSVNLHDLIKEYVQPSTLKAFIKNRIKSGKEYPADLVKVTPFTRASITKA